MEQQVHSMPGKQSFLLTLLLFFFILFPPEIYNISYSIFYLLSALFFFASIYSISQIKISHSGIFLFSLVLFLIWSCFAKPLNLQYVLLFVTYGIYLLLLTNNDELAGTSLFLKGLLIVVIITSVIAVYQYCYGFDAEYRKLLPLNNDFFIAKALAYLKFKRATSTFALPTVCSAFLSMSIPFLFLAFSILKKFWKITAVIAGGLCLCALILTKSFFIAPACIIIVATGLFSRYLSFRKPILYLLILGIVAGVSLTFMLRKDTSLHILKSQTVSMRLGYWEVAGNMMRDHLLWGVGAGNFHIYYPHYMKASTTETKYAHNLIAQLGAETGIMGMLAIIAGCMILIWRVFYGYYRRKITIEYWAYSTAALLFIAYSMIDISLYFPSIGFLGMVSISFFLKEYARVFPEKSEAQVTCTYSLKIAAITLLTIYAIISANLHYNGTMLQRAYDQVKAGNDHDARTTAQKYISYFPYDISSGILLLDISTRLPFIEDRLTLYNYIGSNFTESARLHYLIASQCMQDQLYFNGYVHYCTSPLLYPAKPVYQDACNKSEEFLNDYKRHYEKKP